MHTERRRTFSRVSVNAVRVVRNVQQCVIDAVYPDLQLVPCPTLYHR